MTHKWNIQWKELFYCWLKKKNVQPKSWALLFIQQTFLRLQAWETASHIILRDCSEETKGRPGHIGVSPQRAGGSNVKRLLLISETRYLKEFSAFLYVKMQESALTEILPLIYTSDIWGKYPSRVSSNCSDRSGCSLVPAS